MATTKAKWEYYYGKFDKENCEAYTLRNLSNESKFYCGELIKWTKDIISMAPRKISSPKKILFAGENKKTVEQIKHHFQIKQHLQIKDAWSCGLSDINWDVDYEWNFEEDPPAKIGKFDLIVSQAILPYLLNPYKHVCDLAGLLTLNGYLMTHTVSPKRGYRRCPIDALRFYPDWFEEMAKRLKLIIIKKRARDEHLFYLYQKLK